MLTVKKACSKQHLCACLGLTLDLNIMRYECDIGKQTCMFICLSKTRDSPVPIVSHLSKPVTTWRAGEVEHPLQWTVTDFRALG